MNTNWKMKIEQICGSASRSAEPAESAMASASQYILNNDIAVGYHEVFMEALKQRMSEMFTGKLDRQKSKQLLLLKEAFK